MENEKILVKIITLPDGTEKRVYKDKNKPLKRNKVQPTLLASIDKYIPLKGENGNGNT